MFLTIVILSLYIFFIWRKCYRVNNVAVLPNSLPIIGHSLLLKEESFSLVKRIGDHSLENNGITTILFGPVPVYVITDPVKATVILSTCLEKAFFYKLVNPLFGDVLVSASVSDWKRNRRIAELAFKLQVLDKYMGIFNTQAERLLQMIDKKSGNEFVDITKEITRNILETSCQTTMGMQPNNQDYYNSKYVKAVHEVFEILTLRVQKPWMIFDSIFNLSKAKKDLDKALRVIFEVSTQMVEIRKSEYFERTKNGKTLADCHDKLASFLDIIIENTVTTSGSHFTDIQLRYICDNILLAAFDTTTYELLFTLVCIGSDHEVQRKIYQEIKEILGEEEVVKKEHLGKLTYLEAAIKEAIRLYPIAPIIVRQASEKIKLGDDTFSSGSVLLVHLWAINRHKKHWGNDAEEYNPDRWLDASTLPEHPNSFGSFSFGRRNCIGKIYAMMHMKTTLVALLRKYRVIADHKKMEFDCYIMLKVKSGHLMKFQLR